MSTYTQKLLILSNEFYNTNRQLRHTPAHLLVDGELVHNPEHLDLSIKKDEIFKKILEL